MLELVSNAENLCMSSSSSKVSRFVMQDHKDPQSFTIVERYAHESSQKYGNPLYLLSGSPEWRYID